ncbi:MAG TPA: flagellar hook capping FlgD N-terminal domain-containing protein [Telluria sp.]
MLTNTINNNGINAKGPNGAEVLSSSAPASETADMFTKLLVAQIRNQDPLSPSDPAQFVNQLSQLSQTEAMQSMAKMNSSSASILQSLQVLALGAQVGADVMVAADSVQLDGAKVSGSIELASASAATELVLTGANGVQHKIALGSRGAGPLPFTIDPAALGLAPGRYSMQVTASNGQLPGIEIAGRLDAVRMSANGIILKVSGVGEVAPSQVTGFNGKASTLAAATPPNAF